MYSITEVSQKIGVARSTLLYYERLGIISPRRLAKNNYRRYSEHDVTHLIVLRQLQQAGFSLDECQQVLNGNIESTLIEQHLVRLQQELQQMEVTQQLLQALYKHQTGKQMDHRASKHQLQQWHHNFEQLSADAHVQWLRQMGFSEKEIFHIRWVSRDMSEHDSYMNDFFKVFERMQRQGPGSEQATLHALDAISANETSGDLTAIKTILELGCGRGSSGITLAKHSQAQITALDNHQPFIDDVNQQVKQQQLGQRITAILGDMQQLEDYADGSFDLLWAEGCAYMMGFEKALKEWQRLLRPGGYLFVSDAVWLTDQPSQECADWWQKEYPTMTSPAERQLQAEQRGYRVMERFNLDQADWLAFYADMEQCTQQAETEYGPSQVYEDITKEIRLWRRYGEEYGYVCLVLQKV
ncbi:MAG: MerR family transcriptional regulator [Desulfuromonas sp.]|nr:MerR family transcriptional regulator [Desulfuromonas sp.]